jgi:mannose/fructose/sorbose-specific phosphotransferase system IIA component
MPLIPVLIISHDGLAGALLSSAEMICGQQEAVATLGLEEGDGLTNFMEKVQAKIAGLKSEAGLLVLVDMQGGTPWNATLGACQPGVHILTGVNLGMLIEVLMTRDQAQDVESLAKTGLEAGQISIVHFRLP